MKNTDPSMLLSVGNYLVLIPVRNGQNAMPCAAFNALYKVLSQTRTSGLKFTLLYPDLFFSDTILHRLHLPVSAYLFHNVELLKNVFRTFRPGKYMARQIHRLFYAFFFPYCGIVRSKPISYLK